MGKIWKVKKMPPWDDSQGDVIKMRASLTCEAVKDALCLFNITQLIDDFISSLWVQMTIDTHDKHLVCMT